MAKSAFGVDTKGSGVYYVSWVELNNSLDYNQGI